MTTSPVMGITEELLSVLEAEAIASLGENGTGFVERVTGFSVIDLVAEVRRLRAALAQQPSAAVPEGWKLVPVEPTEQILDALFEHGMQDEDDDVIREAYRAMLAAAPAAPVAVQPLPYWAPCNPACDPELNGSRSKLCDCAQATAALAAPPAAQQPDTVKAPRELLDSAARSCANGWVDYHTARELRALLAGGAA